MVEKPLSLRVYDKPQFAERFGRTGGFAPDRKEQMLRVTADLLLALAPKKSVLLELGAGTGHFTEKMIATGHFSRIYVTDGATAMLEIARQRLPNEHGLLHFDIIDFTTQWAKRFANRRFDVVASTLALHHAENKRQLFSQVFGVLKPQGVFVLGDHMDGSTIMGQRLIRRERALERLRGEESINETLIQEVMEFDEQRQAAEGDRCESVARYETYLNSSGFEAVECLWQDYWQAVFVAQKPAS